jgi:hypothetical protein
MRSLPIFLIVGEKKYKKKSLGFFFFRKNHIPYLECNDWTDKPIQDKSVRLWNILFVRLALLFDTVHLTKDHMVCVLLYGKLCYFFFCRNCSTNTVSGKSTPHFSHCVCELHKQSFFFFFFFYISFHLIVLRISLYSTIKKQIRILNITS